MRELIQVFCDALHGMFFLSTSTPLTDEQILAHRWVHDSANILHWDISPGNIMITEGGQGLLVDWDLSKVLGNASEGPSPPERTV